MDHGMALHENGSFTLLGRNNEGQLDRPAQLPTIAGFDCGAYSTMTRHPDGTIRYWGDQRFGGQNIPEGLTGVIAMAAGEINPMVVKDDGTVVSWGSSYGGTVPPNLSSVTAVARGMFHSLALI
jgi:alpha-tubulin suppressor-like RCC1 family protein